MKKIIVYSKQIFKEVKLIKFLIPKEIYFAPLSPIRLSLKNIKINFYILNFVKLNKSFKKAIIL